MAPPVAGTGNGTHAGTLVACEARFAKYSEEVSHYIVYRIENGL